MNNEEKILFENNFTLETKHNNIKKQTIKNILNMILNTSEFDRNDNLTATLIDLKIKQSTYSNYYLSGIYFVTDENVTQNRTFTGTLNIKNGFAYFNLEITKYGKNTEIIHKEEVLTNFGLSRILRLTTDLTEKEIYSKEILKEEYDKYNNFEKNAIKCLKKGNWNE